MGLLIYYSCLLVALRKFNFATYFMTLTRKSE